MEQKLHEPVQKKDIFLNTKTRSLMSEDIKLERIDLTLVINM